MKTEPTDKDFSKIPHCLIDSGILAQLKPSELKVYLVINRFANYRTGISYPTVKTMCQLAGVNKNLIAKATQVLAKKKLIEKGKSGKKFGFKNCYRITKPQGIDIILAAYPTISKRKNDKKILKGKDGRFITIPQNTDEHIPSNTDCIFH